MADSMKIRAQLQGNVADVRVLMNHPMDTGLVKDAKTGQFIPLHFIQQVTATHGTTVVLDAQWSQAISRNPYLGFKIPNAKIGDKIVVSWIDNKGEKNSVETAVVGG